MPILTEIYYAHCSQVVVATGGGRVVYLEVGDRALTERHHLELESEVSCMDINPIGRLVFN